MAFKIYTAFMISTYPIPYTAIRFSESFHKSKSTYKHTNPLILQYSVYNSIMGYSVTWWQSSTRL